MNEKEVGLHTNLNYKIKVEPGLEENPDTQGEYDINSLNQYLVVKEEKEDLFQTDNLPSESTYFKIKTEKIEFLCEHCGKEPYYRHQIETQLKNNPFHTKETLYKCEQCANKFSIVLKVHTEGALCECKYCENLKTQVRIQTAEEIHESGECSDAQEEYESNSLNEDWLVREDLFKTEDPPAQSTHLKTEKVEFPCKRCEKEQRKLEAQLEDNHDVTINEVSNVNIHTVLCEYCGNLQPQVRTEETVDFEYCENQFEGSSNLKSLVRINLDRKLYACEYCCKQFVRKSNLTTHLRIHTEEKPYECQYCKHKFTQSSNLISHLRIHTGEKPYECEYCKKKFYTSGYLKRHLRIHTGEKPYECKQCGQRFSVNSSLKTHLRIHTGEKPYECEHCKKTFSQCGHYKTHLRIHTGEKPFECEHCEKKFTRNDYLKKHLNLKHTEIINSNAVNKKIIMKTVILTQKTKLI